MSVVTIPLANFKGIATATMTYSTTTNAMLTLDIVNNSPTETFTLTFSTAVPQTKTVAHGTTATIVLPGGIVLNVVGGLLVLPASFACTLKV